MFNCARSTKPRSGPTKNLIQFIRRPGSAADTIWPGQQTQWPEQTLAQIRANVCDVGPALNQRLWRVFSWRYYDCHRDSTEGSTQGFNALRPAGVFADPNAIFSNLYLLVSSLSVINDLYIFRLHKEQSLIVRYQDFTWIWISCWSKRTNLLRKADMSCFGR